MSAEAHHLTSSNMGRTFPEETTVRLMRPTSSGNSLGTSFAMRSVSSPVNSTPVGPAPMTWNASDFTVVVVSLRQGGDTHKSCCRSRYTIDLAAAEGRSSQR